MKRSLDLLMAGTGLIVFSPLFLLIALAIMLDDGRPAFFRQVRVGKGGTTFRIWKFRSMRVDTDETGPLITRRGDPRITRVGAVLRRFKLDELPQIVNVLLGDMSFVGPRPEVPRYVAKYSPDQSRILDLTPGITSPASLTFADEEQILATSVDPERHYIEFLMPEKIRLNLEYADRATGLSDLGVILVTLSRIVRPARSHTLDAPR